jgi:hypothetical protein
MSMYIILYINALYYIIIYYGVLWYIYIYMYTCVYIIYIYILDGSQVQRSATFTCCRLRHLEVAALTAISKASGAKGEHANGISNLDDSIGKP